MKLSPRWGRFAVLLAISACGHSEPFSNQEFGTDQPFDAAAPVRLTLNRGPDRRAAWLPDGSAIVYSAQRAGTRDGDVCLAVLPPGGGRQRSITCNIAPTADQLTEALEPGAPASDERLAFLLGQSGIGALLPATQNLALSTLQSPTSYRTLLSLPYPSSGGRLVGGLSDLQWLGANRLLYLAELVVARRPCQGCEYDTVRTGLEVASLPVDQPSASLAEVVPGTELASGVSPGGTENEIYYTLSGDTRVYRRDLSSGAVSVAHDFGAAGIARDVHVVGQRMTAVVGGRVAFAQDSTLGGAVQWDSGGTLHLVDLQDGSDMLISGPGLFRRPRLSPDATRIVAEVYPLIITPTGEAAETTVARTGDLYLFGQP
jgi:hypothetical protein